MTARDFRAIIKLTNNEQWGFGVRDMRRMLKLQPKGCLVAVDGAKRIGLTTASCYGGELGWIGNVVVDRAYRNKGIASDLVQAAIRRLAHRRVRRVGLYSFPENQSMYERLGFETVGGFILLSILRGPLKRAGGNLKIPFSKILRFDRRAFGADRSKLLRCLMRDFPRSWAWIRRGTELCGYAIVKEYQDSSEIGPSICEKADRDTALALLKASKSLTRKWPLEISIPESNRTFLETAQSAGFRTLRKGLVMSFTELEKVDLGPQVLALGFLDKG